MSFYNKWVLLETEQQYSKGHWSLCLPSVWCCVVLGLMSWTDCLAFLRPSQGPKPRGADLLVSAPLSPITLMVMCVCESEETVPLFLWSSPNSYHLVTSDWPFSCPTHTQTYTHTLRAGPRPSDEWVTTRLPTLPSVLYFLPDLPGPSPHCTWLVDERLMGDWSVHSANKMLNKAPIPALTGLIEKHLRGKST